MRSLQRRNQRKARLAEERRGSRVWPRAGESQTDPANDAWAGQHEGSVGSEPQRKTLPVAARVQSTVEDGEWISTVAAPVPIKPRAQRAAMACDATAAEPETEQVRRLDVALDQPPAHAMRTRDVAVEPIRRPERRERRIEDAWQARTRVAWRWWLWGSGALGLLVAGSVASVVALNTARRASAPRPAVSGFELEHVELDDRFAFYQEDPIRFQGEAIRLLAGYAAARSPQEVLPWVRRPEATRERLAKQWRAWPVVPLLEGPQRPQFALTDNTEPPFMIAWGQRADYLPFRAYFVREGGRLRLDWEATEGICDVPIADLPRATGVRGALVRCELRAQPYYTSSLPESRYTSFSLNSADRQSWVWGYAERDSALEGRLKEVLDEGSVIWEAKERERVTLRIDAAPDRESSNQFLITDMLHIEWVGP